GGVQQRRQRRQHVRNEVEDQGEFQPVQRRGKRGEPHHHRQDGGQQEQQRQQQQAPAAKLFAQRQDEQRSQGRQVQAATEGDESGRGGFFDGRRLHLLTRYLNTASRLSSSEYTSRRLIPAPATRPGRRP